MTAGSIRMARRAPSYRYCQSENSGLDWTKAKGMNFPVILIHTAEGYSVGCPALPGCWSQGATRAEALENIRDAISEVLEVKMELESEQWREDGAEVELANVEVPAHAIYRGYITRTRSASSRRSDGASSGRASTQ